MRVSPMDAADVQRNWHWLAQLLRPSVHVAPGASLGDIAARIASGEMILVTVHVPDGAGVVIVHPGDFDGVRCLWLPYIAGHISGGPKRWVRMMREIMAFFVGVARQAQCAEVRIGGRDYRRVFPDFEPFDPAHPNRLRKRLTHG